MRSFAKYVSQLASGIIHCVSSNCSFARNGDSLAVHFLNFFFKFNLFLSKCLEAEQKFLKKYKISQSLYPQMLLFRESLLTRHDPGEGDVVPGRAPLCGTALVFVMCLLLNGDGGNKNWTAGMEPATRSPGVMEAACGAPSSCPLARGSSPLQVPRSSSSLGSAGAKAALRMGAGRDGGLLG